MYILLHNDGLKWIIIAKINFTVINNERNKELLTVVPPL